MTDIATMRFDAQRKGFHVFEDDDGDGWWIGVPSRPRMPANTQGAFGSSNRAWMAACLIAKDFPDKAIRDFPV